MSGMLGTIVIVIAIIIIANIAKKIQDGEISPFMLEKYKRQIPLIVVIALAFLLISSSIVVVNKGESMVIFNRITKKFGTPIEGGFGLVLPGLFERQIYDVRTQVYTMSGMIQEGNIQRADAIEVLSNDGLKMDLDISVQYRLSSSGLNNLHTTVGKNYVDKIIRPTVQAAIRNEFAQYEATEAYSTKREVIKTKLHERLETALGNYDIIMEEVLLRNIALPPTLVAAIEEKKAAQQEAERMVYVLEKERQEKERVQIEAEAQAERIRIVNEALATNPNYLKWLAIDKLNDNIKLVITDGTTILDLGSYDE